MGFKVYLRSGLVVSANDIETHTDLGEGVCRIWLTHEEQKRLNIIGFVYATYSEIDRVVCEQKGEYLYV